MRVRTINLTSSPPKLDPVQLVSTESAVDKDQDLMIVAYRRIQKSSPDFLTKYDGYNQTVDVTLSTFNVRAVPEHVIALYDFIMTTFVPKKNGTASQPPSEASTPGDEQGPEQVQAEGSDDRIRVRTKLASFQGKGVI